MINKLFLLAVAVVFVSVADARPRQYSISKREIFVHVDVGWRFVYEVDGLITVDGLEVRQGFRYDVLAGGEIKDRDKWVGFGTPNMEELSKILEQCADAVHHRKAFKERMGRVEFDFDPRGSTVWIKTYGGMTRDSEDQVFVSVKLPTSDMGKFRDAVKRVANDFSVIHGKLSADHDGDEDAAKSPKVTPIPKPQKKPQNKPELKPEPKRKGRPEWDDLD